MESEGNAIKKRALSYSWYMRGGASYTDIMNMSSIERDQIGEIIESNLKTTKESGVPFF